MGKCRARIKIRSLSIGGLSRQIGSAVPSSIGGGGGGLSGNAKKATFMKTVGIPGQADARKRAAFTSCMFYAVES